MLLCNAKVLWMLNGTADAGGHFKEYRWVVSLQEGSAPPYKLNKRITSS